jgi:hypothetical protein
MGDISKGVANTLQPAKKYTKKKKNWIRIRKVMRIGNPVI